MTETYDDDVFDTADREGVTCDVCGTVCDPADSMVDSSGTVTLCGGFYGNGCNRFLAAVERGANVADVAGFTYRDVTCEWHQTDGFTLSVMAGGFRVAWRFIGYTVGEALPRFVADTLADVPGR